MKYRCRFRESAHRRSVVRVRAWISHVCALADAHIRAPICGRFMAPVRVQCWRSKLALRKQTRTGSLARTTNQEDKPMKTPTSMLAWTRIVLALTAIQSLAQSVYEPYTFTTLAGIAGYGSAD